MEQDRLEDFKEDFALLIEAGFIAVKQLDETSAKRIFEAAQALRPDSQAPKMGMGSIALSKLDIKEAVRIYGEVLEKEPENYLAQTFLGLAHLLSKNQPDHKKGEKLIREAMEKTTDPTAKRLGTDSLQWFEKEKDKKNKAPFFQ